MANADSSQKVKQAALARTKKGVKNWKLQYYLAVGVAVGSIIVAVLMLVVNPDKGPFATLVNDPNTIMQLNRNLKKWKAGASSFFSGWTIGDVRGLEGISVSQTGGGVAQCATPEGVQLPEEFDARQKWPKCMDAPLYNMGNCTASWAIATASSLSNRHCIADPENKADLMLSAQQLLSCDSQNRGCSGGDIDSAWHFVEREGLLSEICFPYQADSSVSCNSGCTTEKPLKAASHCMMNNELAARKEIFKNGPIVAPVFLNDDFLVYRGGLYEESKTAMQISDSRRQRILHAVKVVGWGNTMGRKYWLVENSWGEDWGENGYAKIIRGGNPSNREGIVVETFMVAGMPASGQDSVDDEDPDFETDLDVDIDADLEDDSVA
jgi:cathepsin B